MTIPRIRSIEPRPGLVLSVVWDTGMVTDVLLSDLPSQPGMADLADPHVFATANVTDWGCTVEWPDGSDMSFRTLWQRAQQAAA